MGEVIRRVTGVSIGKFFADEIAVPLGADFCIGTPASVDERVGHVIPPSGPFTGGSTDPESIADRTARNPRLDAGVSSGISWRRAEIPASNGHGNARSVARVQSVVSHGGEVDGVRLLSASTVNRIFEQQTYGLDEVIGVCFKLGIGYGLVSPETPLGPNAAHVFLGWLGRITGGQRCRRTNDVRLRDEPHG